MSESAAVWTDPGNFFFLVDYFALFSCTKIENATIYARVFLTAFLTANFANLRRGKRKVKSVASSAPQKKHSVQGCHLPEKLVWSTWAATNWSVTYLYVSETHILKSDLKKCTVVQKKKKFPANPYLWGIRRRLCRPMWVLVPGFRNMAPIGLVCFRLREWLVTPRGNDSDMKSNEIY